MIGRRPLLAWLGVLMTRGATALARSRAEDGVFRPLTLDQARKAATDEGKGLVVVDVFTTWCVPCKKLDETTWKDPKVLEWLGRRAVCLKVDAEKDPAAAERYRVNAYPTVVLLRPDGTEVDRLVGYRDAKAFLADADDALAGNDSLARARKALEGAGAGDPMLRMAYGDALAQKGRADDALSEYLWCFDHGPEHGPGFVGVRLSFLLSRIVRLAKAAPTALDELTRRRDEAAAAIEAGRAEYPGAMDVTALNATLHEEARTLALYDRIKGDKSQPVGVVHHLRTQAMDLLLAARRYREVLADADARAEVRTLIDRHEEMKPHVPDDAGLRAFMKTQVVLQVAKYYEALLGAGEGEQAAEVEALLEAFDPVEAFPPLIAAAKRVGDAPQAEALAARSRRVAKP